MRFSSTGLERKSFGFPKMAVENRCRTATGIMKGDETRLPPQPSLRHPSIHRPGFDGWNHAHSGLECFITKLLSAVRSNRNRSARLFDLFGTFPPEFRLIFEGLPHTGPPAEPSMVFIIGQLCFSEVLTLLRELWPASGSGRSEFSIRGHNPPLLSQAQTKSTIGVKVQKTANG